MRFIYFLALLPMCYLTAASLPSNNGTNFYGKQEVHSIQAEGILMLDGTRATGVTTVNGRLQAIGADLDRLDMTGQAIIKNTLIRTGAIINGPLMSEKSAIYKQLSIAAQRITLKATTVESIKVRKIAGYKGPQILELLQGTKVTGPIIFESENGEIIISSDSEIEGAVTGPKVPKMKIIGALPTQ